MASEADGWGNLDEEWDAESFDAAVKAGPKDDRRAKLVGDLVANVFPAMRGTSEFVDIDRGLSIISQHARQLGYDGLILFLDELILWLASHAADSNFIAQEGQKLAKLVESQNADRPTPIVSFIARQRDLRELVGENMLGVQQVTFADSLKHWDQRFDVVRLDDRNLTTIAEKRVLRPKSEAARQQIDQAFRETDKIREDVLSVLLTNSRSKVDFRAVYPFSPALIETLVALSSLLQRERTALKIMFQLLVEQRDTLQLGSVVPVGDLFDVIMRGEEPFSEVMKAHAENAKRLYLEKILPLIEKDIGLSQEEVLALPLNDSRRAPFMRDTRLAKTLLLASLAPEVEAFKDMTVNRLAALNHGSIRTPIPGAEGQVVNRVIRKWAAEIGQIRVGDEPINQTVTVQLTGVDTEGILAQAANEDNEGNRVRMIKRLLFEKLGIQAEDSLIIEHTFSWRATPRSCEVLFSNVRELNDESLRNDGENWKLIIDYPFDASAAHSPRDDSARVEKFRVSHSKGARTLVWLPSFFSQSAKKSLGRLVVLDHVLTGPRFDGYASRLTAIDRAQARTILDNQRSSLRVSVLEYLDRAYGVGSDTAGILDTTHQLDREEQALSLHPEITVRPPAAANLTQALAGLLEQALAGQFPGHPLFEPDAKLGRAAIQRVWAELQKALSNSEGRTMVDATQRRDVKAIVTALKLANMSEAHLALDSHWRTHFERKIAQNGSVALSVVLLRSWLNEPKAMGLPAELENLVLLTFAAQTNRAWFRFGSNPHTAAIDDLPDNAELREQSLPDEQTWTLAIERSAAVFGLAPSPLRSASNAAKLAQDLGQQIGALLEPARGLVRELQNRLSSLNLTPDSSARLKSAQAGLTLLESIRTAPEQERIGVLANAKLDEKGVGVGTALKQAETVVRYIRETHWSLIESASKLPPAGDALLKRTQELFQHDELALPLVTTLKRIIEDAVRLLSEKPAAPVQAPLPPIPVAVPVVIAPPVQAASAPLVTGVPPAVAAVSAAPVVQSSSGVARGWTGSDEAEVSAFYSGDADKIARNRQLVKALKALYRQSQIEGDSVPKALPQERLVEVLEVHHIQPLAQGGADERHNMIVVTPTLHALIHADPTCAIDLKAGTIRLFGRDLKVQVDAAHNG